MALKLPKLGDKQYMYIGFASALLGAMSILGAILSILKLLDVGLPLGWVYFTAGGILFMLVATLAFHKIGRRRMPV